MLEQVLELCNADQWHGEVPQLDTTTKFLASTIFGLACPFWVADTRFLLARFEKERSPSLIAKLDAADAASLGYALRLKKLAYIAAMEHKPPAARAANFDNLAARSDGHLAGAWGNFVSDDQIGGPAFVSYLRSARFRSLVEDLVPAALFPRWDAVADLTAVVWAQHVAILQYRSAFRIPANADRTRQIDRLLNITDPSQDMEMFLLVRNTTEEGFCAQPPGLRQNEYAEFVAGKLTLRQLYRMRPAFIFRTLLPRPVVRH